MSLSGGNDENTLLLLHGEDLTDSSPKGVAITNNGVSVSSAQSKFGGKSLYFNGTSRLQTDGSIFNFGTGDFTVDFWAYKQSGNGGFYLSPGVTGGMMIGPYTGNSFGLGREAVAWDVTMDFSDAANNVWNHIAVVRKSGTLYMFLNGRKVGSVSNTQSYSMNGGKLTIGVQSYEMYGNQYAFTGYIDEYRISNIARWTENFTPPTEPYSIPIPPIPSNFRLSSSTEATATLAWSAVDGATGYKLYRDGILIATLTGTSYTDTIQPFTSYIYTLTAYNDSGESDPASISVQIIIPPETPSNFRASSASMTAISLAWDAVTGADSYQLKRNGSVIYSGEGTSYTDSGLTAETAYTYTLSAVNTTGSSVETMLGATTTQFVLVTDRTAADVAEQNAKGTYNAADLNRVGEAMNYVADRLKAAGYDPHISPKTDWKETDWPTPSDMERYLRDVSTLRGLLTQMETTPDVPKSMEKLTHWTANDIEQILMDMNDTIARLKAAMFYAGEIYSGEG